MAIADSTARRRNPAKSATRRMINDFVPPEAVPLHFEVGTLGSRFGAQIIDILITVLAVGALLLFLGLTDIVPGSAMTLLGSLLFFAIRVPYYTAAELMWNGQTLGKRISSLRVISSDGRGLSAHSVVVRNLMKEAEVFVPGTYLLVGQALDMWTNIVTLVWIAILIAVPLFNAKRQRLGDMIAGTYVIHQPEAILVPDLAAAKRTGTGDERFSFLPHQMDHYGRYELQTLEKVLHLNRSQMSPEEYSRHHNNMSAIARNIRKKIMYEEKVADRDAEAFLDSFYIAQRRYLEQRKLFGDTREDKFHKDDDIMPEGKE
jgi:uncharacterized RDD family membrane protein YckC